MCNCFQILVSLSCHDFAMILALDYVFIFQEKVKNWQDGKTRVIKGQEKGKEPPMPRVLFEFPAG